MPSKKDAATTAKRYYIDADEVYPEYSVHPIEEDGGVYPGAVEIPDDFIERYDKAAAEWAEIQGILGEYEEKSREQYNAYLKEHGCKKMYRDSYGSKRQCRTLLRSNGTCPRKDQHVAP